MTKLPRSPVSGQSKRAPNRITHRTAAACLAWETRVTNCNWADRNVRRRLNYKFLCHDLAAAAAKMWFLTIYRIVTWICWIFVYNNCLDSSYKKWIKRNYIYSVFCQPLSTPPPPSIRSLLQRLRPISVKVLKPAAVSISRHPPNSYNEQQFLACMESTAPGPETFDKSDLFREFDQIQSNKSDETDILA